MLGVALGCTGASEFYPEPVGAMEGLKQVHGLLGEWGPVIWSRR
jgi:hypothetical protein